METNKDTFIILGIYFLVYFWDAKAVLSPMGQEFIRDVYMPRFSSQESLVCAIQNACRQGVLLVTNPTLPRLGDLRKFTPNQ